MTSFFKRALSMALILCTLASLAAPFSLFAAEEEGHDYIYRETFSGETINTSGSNANITEANGTFVCVSSGSTFTLENKTLKYLTRASKDYMDIRLYLSSDPTGCTDDFVLSFWIKPDAADMSMTGMTWKQNSGANSETGIFELNKGYFKLGGTTYKTAQLVKDEWSLVEIVFHYDDNATADGGETGAVTSYTFRLNGNDVKDADGNVVEIAATYKFHNVDYYRLFRYAGTTTYELDDLTLTRGTASLIDVPRTDPNSSATRDFYFRETFSSGKVNTSGSQNDCVAANGYFLGDLEKNGSKSTYTLDNDSLKFTSLIGNTYTDIRFYYTKTAQDCTNDFTLSFWIKPDSDKFKMTTFTWSQYSVLSADKTKNEQNIFKIIDGYYQINGTTYKSAYLPKDIWSLVEIVFHYDENATSVDGQTGATTYYTFMLNGEPLKDANGNVVEAPATYYFHNIDRYRMLQWANGTYELDDLSIVKGTQSLIDIPRTAPSIGDEEGGEDVERKVFYREEFNKGYTNAQNTASAIVGADGFWLNTTTGIKYNNDGEVLNITTVPTGDGFIDLRYYLAGLKKDFTEDFLFSFWIKPTTDNFSTSFAWRDDGHSKWESAFKITDGCITVNGTKYPDAKLPANGWSLVEIAAYYDENATAVTGEKGAVTRYVFMLNGNVIAEANASILFHNVDNYRIFRYISAPFAIDDLTIVSGTDSLKDIVRSTPTEKPKAEILFSEDFSAPVNTDASASAIASAGGIFLSDANGTLYTQEEGTLRFIRANHKDYVGLQFFHEGAKLNLSQDFILSFKIRTKDLFAFNFQWKDSAYSSYETSMKIQGNRFTYADDHNSSGQFVVDTFLYPNQWAQVEIVFHYDEHIKAVTGEQGAIAYYTILLNGKPVQTVKTQNNFHKIDDFKLFTRLAYEFEVDDIVVATGNVSITEGYLASGWETHEYFCDAEEVTDYDYSIVVVGDTQCMAEWYPEDFATTYDWILGNVDSKKMQAVIGVGDITNNDTDTAWTTATNSLFKMNGIIPYVLVRGNHDGSANYNKYLNNPAYTDQFAGKGGFFGNESVETSYYTFDAGNDKYLVIGLDFGPTDEELAWAGEIIAANPDRKVIITTHGYLGSDGKTLTKYDFGAPTTYEAGVNDGDDIWEKLGSKYENVAFIISGHIGTDEMVATKVTGDHGNTVTQLLINYQTADNALKGLGLVTVLYFKDGSPDIVVRNYATVQQKYFGENNQFVLNTEADKPAKLPDVIFKDDFNDGSVNTDPDGDKVAADNGIFVCVQGGSEYTLENGTLKYTKRISGDYIDLRFYYDTTKHNLSRDFNLSFKIKPASSNLSMQFGWRDRVYDKWDDSLEISGGRFRVSGKTNPDAVIPANEWSLVEIAFHFNPDTLSIDGKRGAIWNDIL